MASTITVPTWSADQAPAMPAKADRCYGALVWQARTSDGNLAFAAWIVGPFTKAECSSKTGMMSRILPTPIEGGTMTLTDSGSPSQIRHRIVEQYGCVHQDRPGMNSGPDRIAGIYQCSPKFRPSQGKRVIRPEDIEISEQNFQRAVYNLKFNGDFGSELEMLRRLGVQFQDSYGRAREFGAVVTDAAAALQRLVAGGRMTKQEAEYAASEAGLYGSVATAVANNDPGLATAFKGFVNKTIDSSETIQNTHSEYLKPDTAVDSTRDIIPPHIDHAIAQVPASKFYPKRARKQHRAGEVILKVQVMKNGQLQQAVIDNSSGYQDLDQAALKYVRALKFVPGTNQGIPADMWGGLKVHFALEEVP
jgi:TonB family protein